MGFVAKEINPTSKNVFSGGQVFYDLVLPLQKWEPGIFPHAVNSTKTNFVGLTISPTCKIFSFATQYSMLAAELWLLMRTFICISACIPLTLPFSFAGLAVSISSLISVPHAPVYIYIYILEFEPEAISVYVYIYINWSLNPKPFMASGRVYPFGKK